MKKKLKIINLHISNYWRKSAKSHSHKVHKSSSLPFFFSPFILLPLIFGLVSLILLSCSDPKLENPFDPESQYTTSPIQGQLALTQLTDSEVKLEWQLNSTIVGNYIIKRKINTGSFEILATVSKDTNNFTDTELLTTNTYHYQLIGANGDVQTEPISNSISTTFTEIESFTIQQENLFTAKLTWQHNCNYEEGYIIERQEVSSRENPLSKNIKLPLRRGDAEGRGVSNNEKNVKNDRTYRDFIQIADLTTNTLEYIDETLLPNHTYEYRIKAYTSFNESGYKNNDVIILFPEPDNCVISQDDVHTFSLIWNDNSNGEQGFNIERKIDDEAYTLIHTNAENDTTYVDDINTREQFETVYYKIYAFYEDIYSDYLIGSCSINFSAPTNLQHQQLTISSIQLTWDDNSNDESGFKIDKKVGTNTWQIEYATVEEDTTTWIDTNAEINEDLQYRVYAYSGTNQSDSITTGIIDNTFPAPDNLQYEHLTISSIQLTWDDNSNGEEGFKINKKVGTNAWQPEYAVVGENIEEWTDVNAEINEILQYRVYAFSGNNNSPSIETGEIDNSIPAPDNLQYQHLMISSIQLSWDDNSNGEEGFKIDKKVGATTWQEEYGAVTENDTTWTDNNAEINEILQYRVYAFSGNNNSPSIETGEIVNSIPAPENLTYTLENISYPTADIHLDWDYSMGGIDGFKVKKNGTLLPEVIPAGTTEWTDIGVNIENSNTYQVLAFYQTYNSAFSNEVSASISCTDYDGNEYDVILIGDQIWMAENLKVTHYRNGDEIENVTDGTQWANLTTGAYCYYDNNAANGDIYGALYNWYAVAEDDTRGLAPEGWHVPTDDEIMILEMELGMSQSQANSTGYRGTNEGSKLAGNAALWNDGALENDPEFGSSGFDFLPGGYRSSFQW